ASCTLRILKKPSGPARLATRPNLTAIAADAEHDRDHCVRGFDRANGSRRAAGHGDDRDPTANEFGRQLRHAIILALGPAILDRDVLPFDKADFAETSAECR